MISPSVNLGKRTETVKNAKIEMKKSQPKRRRIPRRGPGVAELEKILNDQQQGGQDSDQHSPPPPLPPPCDYSSWSDLPSLPSLGIAPPPLPTAVDAAENPVFSTTPKLSDTQLNIPSIYFPNLQFSASSLDRPYYCSMVNFIRGCASSAGRNYDELEHPSSQRSTDFNHPWTSPEKQEQMVNAKWPMGCLEESNREPNLQGRIVPIFPNITLQNSSSLETNFTATNLDSHFRGTKRGFAGQLMSSTNSSGSHQLAEDNTNLMEPGSSSTSNQFASAFNFQETTECSRHGNGGSASDKNNITYDFLYESNLKSTIRSKDEVEVEEDGIDLDLKL